MKSHLIPVKQTWLADNLWLTMMADLLTQNDTHRPPRIFIDPTADNVFLFSCFSSVFSSSGSSCKLYMSLLTSMHSPLKLGFSNTKAWMREGKEGVKDEPQL